MLRKIETIGLITGGQLIEEFDYEWHKEKLGFNLYKEIEGDDLILDDSYHYA